MRILQFIIFSGTAILSGCADLPDNLRGNPYFNVADHPVKKLVIMEVPTDAPIKSWEQIASSPPPKDHEIKQRDISLKLETLNVETLDWASSLLQNQGFKVVPTNHLELTHWTIGEGVIHLETLQKIRSTTGADAVFRFHVTDVGSIPQIYDRWMTIGTVGFIAGAVVVTYTDPVTRKFIGAYLLSELIQESAEAYGGYSIVDHYYRFARIEAELIDTQSGKTLWQDASTCAGRGEMLAEYPAEIRDKTETRISVALKRAMGELASSAGILQNDQK